MGGGPGGRGEVDPLGAFGSGFGVPGWSRLPGIVAVSTGELHPSPSTPNWPSLYPSPPREKEKEGERGEEERGMREGEREGERVRG